MEQSKTATRDYPALSDAPWGLWDVLYGRRSHRRFLPADYGAELVGSLNEVVELATAVRGAPEGSIVVVTERGRVERIKTRIHRGVQGKINLWLHRSPVAGFLLLALPRDDAGSDRPQLLPLTAMAAEDAVLWLTEEGLGTCWLGGINQRELREAAGLGKEAFVCAAIPFGKPKPEVRAGDIDHMMYRAISGKRRALSDIAYLEDIDHPYPLGALEKEPFAASDTQDVAGLLRQLRERRESSPSTPIALALDACFEAARISPNAGNAQQWHFIGVRGEEATGELARACGAEGAWRAAVVGAADPGRSFMYERMEKPFWVIDVAIALSQMSLTAASMDLALDLGLRGIDEAAVNAVVGLRPPLRGVGVMGIR